MSSQRGSTLVVIVSSAVAILTLSAGPEAMGQPPVPATQPQASSAASLQKLMAAGSQPAEPLRTSGLLVDRPDERVAILSNGMRVILKQYKVAPIVAVRMYVRTGSIYEDPFLGAGLSHLFEHLLACGSTTTRTEEQSRVLLEKIGGDSNAYTTYDHTCYYINTAAKYLDTAVDLLSDWITRPAFPDSEFQRELGVVQRELERSLDDPDTQLHQLTMKILFAGHPAQFPVIGYKQDIQALTKQDVVNYWRDRYIPDNVTVSICGDIDLEHAMSTVIKYFSDFGRRPLDLKTLPEAPRIISPRGATRKMEVNAAMLNMCWPSIRLTNPDLYALDLASFVLTAGPSSRLTSDLVYRRRLAAAVGGSSWTPEWARGVFDVLVRCPPDDLLKVRQAVLDAVARLATEPVSEEELAKAKRQKTAEYVQGLQKVDSLGAMLAMDLMSTGDLHFSASYVDRIQKVTAEDIRRVARTYLQPESLVSVLVAPRETDLAEWEKATATKTLGQPGKIKMLKLDNGLRVLLQTNPATPMVSVQFYGLGGLLGENAEDNGISNLMAEASLRGTKTRSGEQIADFFDSIGASVDAAAGANTFYYKVEVLSQSLPDALNVLADVILNPSFEPQAVDEVRKPILDQIRRIDENWRSELFQYLRKDYFGEYPYGMEPIGQVDSVSHLTGEQLRQFHDRHLAGPSCVLAIFGDIDEAKVERQVREMFAKMPSPNAPAMAGPAPGDANPGKLFIKVKSPDRRVAGIGIAYPSVGFTDVKDRMAMTVLDTITSGYQMPSGWLQEALRGGTNKYVYEVHGINWTGLKGGFFPIYAGTQPEQASKVISIILDLMTKAREGRFEPEEMERAKGVILTTQLLDRQTNGERAAMAALDELYGLGYDFSDRLPELMDAIQMADVRDVAKRFLITPLIVVVTPEPQAVRVPGFQEVIEPAQTQPPQTQPTQTQPMGGAPAGPAR
jgi:zinc protease